MWKTFMGSGVKDGFHLCQNQVLKKSFIYVRFKQSKPRVCFSLRIIKHENTVEEGGILLVYLEIENTYSSTLDILGSSRWFKYLFLKGFCGFLKKKKMWSQQTITTGNKSSYLLMHHSYSWLYTVASRTCIHYYLISLYLCFTVIFK